MASCDLIINTISAPHEVSKYTPYLRNDGVIVQLGVVTEPQSFNQIDIVFTRKSIVGKKRSVDEDGYHCYQHAQQCSSPGSLIGGIKRTQECIDFCFKHNILPEVEIIPGTEIGNVLQKLEKKNDQIVRYVIDIANTAKSPAEAS